MIETQRLSLRQVSASDAEFLYALMTGPEYLQYIGDRGICTVEDASAYIEANFVTSYRRFGYGLYLVEEKKSMIPIGICGFVRRDSLDHPDIGYAFLREYWSQGFAHEAARATLDYGFGQLGMATLLGVTSPENAASIRLLKKLGMDYQKMVRIPPSTHDSMLFSLHASQVLDKSMD